MKFTVDAPEASHGISVIREIPDEPLCRIEGRNGIGKTLAMHLLELCTGQQPYAARSDAWRTLCEYLGSTTITVEGLRGPEGDDDSHELRFVFDWRSRADDPLPIEIRRGLFEEITLDGDDIEDMDDVRRWLTVVRIAGDETLTETIAGLVAHDRELLRTASRVALDRGRYVDGLFDALLVSFRRAPADAMLAVSKELRELSAARADLVADRESQNSVVGRYEAVYHAHAAVVQVTADAETLDTEIQSLAEQLETARQRRETAEEELRQARTQQRLSEEATKQLASAQRSFTRRLRALERADDAIVNATGRLGIGNDETAVRAALERLAGERAELAAERADLSDLFALRDLLDRMVQALAPAAAGGLRARTVATVSEQAITAGQLLDAVRVRRDRLTVDAPAVEELDEKLAKLDERESDLRALEDAYADRAGKRDKLAEAERALEELGDADGPADDLVTERAAAQAAAQRVEIEVGSALGAAEKQRARLGGGLSLEDLEADLQRRLSEAETTVEAFGDGLRKARAMLVAVDDRLDTADARRDELVGRAAELERELADQTHRLHAEDRHSRLRDVLGDRAPRVGDAGEDIARCWVAVHAAQDRAVQRLQGSRGRLDAVARNMSELVDVIRDKAEASPELDPIRRLYQERLQERFDQEEILKAVFDGGTLTRVDLATREIRWKTQGDEPRVRPFEAFSSGERAFAYVQARLGSVSHATSLNRVVVVDEFGAFLSRDRLIRLQQVVQRQLNDDVVHQAIVVLPLGTVSESTNGEEGPELVVGRFEMLPAA